MGRGEVGLHADHIHDQTLHQPGHAIQHVVRRHHRIRQHDALHRRVRDVTLVPQGNVLAGRRHVPAQQPGHPAEALATGSGSFCAASPTILSVRLERLCASRIRSAADGGSRLPCAPLARPPVRAPPQTPHAVSRARSAWSTWTQLPQASQGELFDARVDVSVVADAPEILPQATPSTACPAALVPFGLRKHDRNFSPNDVGSAWMP